MNQNAQTAFLNMIEFLMASYEAECLKTRPKRRELDRLETILRSTWVSAHSEVEAAMTPFSPRERHSRVLGVLQFARLHNDTPTDAIARFFLQNRYPTK